MHDLNGRPLLPVPRRVARVRRETADTVSLTLEAAAAPLPFAPGQFNMLYAFAVGEAAISMAGDPARPGEIVHTIKGVGAVTRALCGLRRGAEVGVRGPFGRPWPTVEARGQDLLLVAGGIGLAPLRPVICAVLATRAAYGRVTLLAGARTPDDLLYQRDLARWRERRDVEIATIVDRASPGWTGRVGVVPALVDEAAIDPARTVALVCGPEVMMRFTVRALAARGLADERIFLSLERNMRCAVGFCGHCQLGPDFVCKDGPVFRFDRIRDRFWQREV